MHPNGERTIDVDLNDLADRSRQSGPHSRLTLCRRGRILLLTGNKWVHGLMAAATCGSPG